MNSLHHAWTVIETSRPMRAFRAHRHLLLAPMFFLAVSLMLTAATANVLGGMPVASVLSTGASVVTLPAGSLAMPSSNTTYGLQERVLTLHEGSMMFKAQGMGRVHLAQDTSLSGWHGGFTVLRDAHALTVAAVSTPVVFRAGSGTLLIPQGMQWNTNLDVLTSATGATRSALLRQTLPGPLPTSYLTEQLRALQAMQKPERSPSLNVAPITAALSGIVQRKDREGVRLQTQKDQLRTDLSLQRTEEVLSTLRLHGATIFSGSEGQAFLSEVLAMEAVDEKLRTVLLSFVEDHDLSLLLLLHPDLHAESAFSFDSGADTEALLWDMPLSDIQTEPFSVLLVARWSEASQQYVEQSPEISVALEQVLTAIRNGVQQQRSRKFFYRMQEYVHTAKLLSETYKQYTTEQTHALLAEIQTLATPPVEQIVSQELSLPAEPEKPLTTAEVELLQQSAKTMLRQHGAMFTKATEFHIRSAHDVGVEHVAFSTPQGDEQFSFSLDPSSQTLHAILRNGQTHSFAVTLEQFVDWILKN